MRRRFLFAAGGTGGHVLPALAVFEAMRDLFGDFDSLFVCSGRELELSIYRARGIEPEVVGSRGIPREFSWEVLRSAWRNLKSLAEALEVLRGYRPHLVFTTGGYIGFPFAVASRALGVPCLVHEQNLRMGLSNSLSSRLAHLVLLSWRESLSIYRGPKFVLSGMPIRRMRREDEEGRLRTKERLGLSGYRLCVGVLGGSLGSLYLLDLASSLAKELSDVAFLLAGSYPEERLRGLPGNVVCMGFLEEMSDFYCASDLVLSRAGAGALAEICSFALPSVLIPWEGSAGGHQLENALMVKRAGGAEVLREGDPSTFDRALSLLKDMLDPGLRREMGLRAYSLVVPDAASRAAKIVWGCASGGV